MFKMLCFIALFAVLGLPACLGSNNVYNLNERDFEGYIRDKDIMLVDFFAPWCHHCQELGPELDAAADQLATKNQFSFAKVDCVNDGKQLCQRFNVQGYPTIKLFKYGQYVGDYVGQRDRSSLLQYVDSVASTMSQHAPLTSGVPQPLALAQAVNYKPQAQVFPSHHAAAIHAPAPAVAPTFTNQANMHATNPSLMASFYGSSAHAQHPASATAAFLGNTPPVQPASPDSLQAKFGNMASLDVYRSKLKMIAAYKNYQRRLKEYRIKLTASKTSVHPSPQGYAGAVTQPPRPGVNAFAQHQSYRGYYRPEALAAQNVQINRAYPQAGYQAGYPNQFASPYGYQALASSPYYRSKTSHGKRRHGKQKRPAARPAAAAAAAASARKAAYNRQKAAYYYKQKQQQQQQKQQQQFRQQQQQRQQPLRQAPPQQFRQEPQQQQLQQEPQQQQQQFQQEPQQQQQQQQQQQFQQEPHKEQQNYKQQQDYKSPQAPQVLDNPALPIPAQSSNSPAKPDTSALKDLKADIESAIQDALRNAVSKGSEKTKPSPSVHVDGERAKPQATAAAPEQAGSGSGVQSPSHSIHGSVSVEDAVTGEAGSGSGLKPDSP